MSLLYLTESQQARAFIFCNRSLEILVADMIFDETTRSELHHSCLFMSFHIGSRFHERKKITSSILEFRMEDNEYLKSLETATEFIFCTKN